MGLTLSVPVWKNRKVYFDNQGVIFNTLREVFKKEKKTQRQMTDICQLIGGSHKPVMVRRLEFRCKNAKIFFRILPMSKICWENVKILDDRETIYVRYLQELDSSSRVARPSYWRFKTDGIFYNNTQTEIYETVVPELLENVVKGHHAIIFSYGQTGTGKSLTSIGIENSFEDRGIIPRLVSNLYSLRDEFKSKFKMCFKLSYVEATKTHIRDLLTTETTSFDVHSIKEVGAQVFLNEQEMLKAIYKAEGRKTLTKNSAYPSHAASSVLTITVISKHVNESSFVKTCSKIHIVDLAGADCLGNKSSLDKNLEDITTGNLVKSHLEQFLLVLIENIPEQIAVKQRLNILIKYLKDCLHGGSMLRFIGHIRVDDENLLITMSMLRFGQIVRGLKPKKMQLNRYDDQETKIKTLEEELKELKVQKEIDSMIRNEDLRANLTQDRVNELKNVAEDYLKDKIDELAIANIADINVVLQVFKNMFKQAESERAANSETGYRRIYDDGTSRRSSIKSILSAKSSRRTTRSKESARLGQGSARQLKDKNSKIRSLTRRSMSKGSTRSTEKAESAVQSKLDALNDARSKDSVAVQKSTSGSRSTSKVVRKGSGSQRRSSNNSDKFRDKLYDDYSSLPARVPSPSEAWKDFMVDETFNYEELRNQIEEYETETKRLNGYYMEELRKLQSLREWLDLCRNKLEQVRMQRELSGAIDKDDNGEMIKSEQELVCEEMLFNGERQLVQQQEVVLSIQSELRIFLEMIQEKRKKISDGFDAFCAEKFRTLVPICATYQEAEMIVHDAEKNVEEALLTTDSLIMVKEETAKIAALETQVIDYERLQLLTSKQREKIIRERAVNKKWIRSCKTK